MKYMVISDIHGGIYELNKVLDIYSKENCNKLLILGDLFNYGFDLNKKDIINRLNLMSENIIAVIGNCDINTNGILFDMTYKNTVELNDKIVTITHGHLYNKDYLVKLNSNIIFMGHTHIADIDLIDDKIFVNPGSLSKSRSGENSFCIVDEDKITIRNLDNIILNEYSFE